MIQEIRTKRGKLVGRFNEQTRILSIKDGNKVTEIEIPTSGLKLSYTPGDGIVEEIVILPQKDKPHVA